MARELRPLLQSARPWVCLNAHANRVPAYAGKDAAMPFAYPVFLSLEGQHCLVAGLGEVGQRKLAGLLAAGVGSVLALDCSLPENMPATALETPVARLAADPRVRLASRACTAEDVCASRLVFAATGDARENARIAALCRKAGVLCNCASDPGLGQFAVPAVARCGDICCALSTGGASPALARRLRRELPEQLKPHAALARFMGRLRPLVLAMKKDARHNGPLFRKLANSPLGQWLAAGNLALCRDWLAAELPADLAAQAMPLLEDMDSASSMQASPLCAGQDKKTHELC